VFCGVISCVLYGLLALAVSFLTAGILSGAPLKLNWVSEGEEERGKRYRFFLSCATFFCFSLAGCGAAARGRIGFVLLYLLISVCGLICAILVAISGKMRHGRSFVNDGAPADCSNRMQELEETASDIHAACESITQSDCEKCEVDTDRLNVSFGDENSELTAKNDFKYKLITVVNSLLKRLPMEIAVACGMVFIIGVVAAIFLFSSVERVMYEPDTAAGTVEASVAFDSVEIAEDALFLRLDEDITYGLFGYSPKSLDFQELTARIEAGESFLVRAVTLNRDEWSAYYRLIEIRGEDGTVLLGQTDTVNARNGAVTRAAITAIMLALPFGIICGYRFALEVCVLRKREKMSRREGY